MSSLKWIGLGIGIAATAGILIARQSEPNLATLQENGSYTLNQILQGTVVPLTLKREALPSNYHSVLLVNDASATLDSLRVYAEFEGGGTDQYRRMIAKITSYTSGQAISVDGSKYYVTYRSDPQGLRLHLVRCDSVRTITPYPEAGVSAELNPSGTVLGEDIRKVALDRIKQVGLATMLYMSDYDDVFPLGQDTTQVVKVLQPYAKNVTIFQSPQKGGAFHYNVHLSGKPLTEVGQVAETPMWKEDLPLSSDPFAVVFADGHAKTMDEAAHPIIENSWKDWQKKPALKHAAKR